MRKGGRILTGAHITAAAPPTSMLPAAVLPGTPHAEQPRVDGLPLESGRICGIGMGLVWPEACTL
jgi:hypothetical protein